MRSANVRCKICWILGSIFFLMLVVWECSHLMRGHRVWADGGAPNLAYVSGTAKGISRIDIAQQKITGTIAVSGSPHEILLSYDGRFLYVTQPTLGRFSMLAARTGRTVCQANIAGAPSLLAFDPINNLIYVAGHSASTIIELSSLDCSYKKSLHAQSGVYGMALAQAGANMPQGAHNQLYVTTSNALDVFDVVTGRLASVVPIVAGPRLISIPPGGTAYIITRQGNIVALSLHSNQMETIVRGGSYGPMDFDEDTSDVFVPDRAHNRVLVLSPVSVGMNHSPEPQRTISFPAAPISIAITSDGQFGFVALANGTVAMLDLPGHQLLKTIVVGGEPHFIITGVYAPVVGITAQETTLYGTVITILADSILALLGLGPILVYVYYLRKRRLHRGYSDVEHAEQQKEPIEK